MVAIGSAVTLTQVGLAGTVVGFYRHRTKYRRGQLAGVYVATQAGTVPVALPRGTRTAVGTV